MAQKKTARNSMSYKASASANRDALFGGAAGSSGAKKKKSKPAAKTASTSANSGPTADHARVPASKGYVYGGKNKTSSKIKVGLSGEAKAKKIKEAEEYRDKAKKAMQKGLFSRPDPLVSSTYYKRAADAYQQCGEARLERLYRMNSADCQAKVGAWATAAAEYTRAAELVQECTDETPEMKREIGRKLHLSAAEAWTNMNEKGKAAASSVKAAFALVWDEDSSFLPKLAIEALEEAVEMHVPDPLNHYAKYRQTGISAYKDPNSDGDEPSPELLDLAKQNLITTAYAHESAQEVMYLFITYGEYASALYTAGAITELLSSNGVSTLTLSRAFVAETILSLAMGDPIAAEDNFLNYHVQKTHYLSSRECKLAEELFRAVKMRDPEALEEARAIKGTNRAAIGNLHESLRDLVSMIRISGVARRGAVELETTQPSRKEKSSKKSAEPAAAPASFEELAKKTGYEEPAAEDKQENEMTLQDELDALDFGDDESDLDDDDIDLR